LGALLLYSQPLDPVLHQLEILLCSPAIHFACQGLFSRLCLCSGLSNIASSNHDQKCTTLLFKEVLAVSFNA
jgi:hypothetical protein